MTIRFSIFWLTMVVTTVLPTRGDTVHVRNESLIDGTISPFQTGQFVEFLSNVVPSMHAEKVYDGSFVGLIPYLAFHIRETDFQENPWYPSGAVHRGEYTLDPADPFNGKVSQCISVGGEHPCVLGISQDGIFVEQGKRYMFSLLFPPASVVWTGDGLHRERS